MTTREMLNKRFATLQDALSKLGADFDGLAMLFKHADDAERAAIAEEIGGKLHELRGFLNARFNSPLPTA